MENNNFEYLEMKTPFGLWQLVSQGDEIVAFGDKLPLETRGAILNKSNPILQRAEKELSEYFIGNRKGFTFKIGFAWGTEFQKSVWRMLLKIPYGQTWTYREQAEKLNKDKAFRAVGSANGKNPLCVIVPCHRVVAVDGGLGGYSAGLRVKKSLLALEASEL